MPSNAGRSATQTPPAPMSGPELRAWREHWYLTQAQLARWCGVHVNTINRWETSARDIPIFLRPALETLERELSAEMLERARGPQLANAGRSAAGA